MSECSNKHCFNWLPDNCCAYLTVCKHSPVGSPKDEDFFSSKGLPPIALSKPPGLKDDDGKPRYDLLPFEALEPVVRVLTYGAKKYGDDNWKLLENPKRRYFAACLRHVAAWGRGEETDPESGESHLAHAVCCLLYLLCLDSKKS